MAQKTIDEKVDAGHGSFTQGSEKLSNGSLGASGSDSDYINNGLRDAENFANSGNSSPDSAKDLNSQESEAGPTASWNNNTSPSKDGGGGFGPKKGMMNSAKTMIKGMTGRKKGAIGGIIALVVGGGLGFSALFSPGMLIVHMKEIATDKLDTSSLSLNARSNRLLLAKIDDSTKGYCGSVMTAACRYSTLSEKNIKNLRAAGIEISPETKKALGRYRPTSYVFTDGSGAKRTITASEFKSFSRENPDFRSALKKAYNPRFSQFTGSAWAHVSKKLGIDKKKTQVLSGTKQENAENVNKIAKQSIGEQTEGARNLKPDPECGDDCDANTAKRNADLDAKANEIKAKQSTASSSIRSALSATSPAKMLGSSAVNAVKVTGAVDGACMAYNAVRAVGYAAKTVRALQLASYAMIFLKVADEIKSGTADAETVAYLGSVLTAVALDAKSTNERISGSATDSFGYKYLAFGDTGASSSSASIASQYLAGGGFTGELITFTDQILSTFPGGRQSARDTCKTLANPWVQAGSLIGGVALMFIPGGQAISGANIARQVASSAVLGVGLALLPGMMADIDAGTVTDNINGEHSGNAWASGSGKIFSDMNQATGNPALTVDQAVEYASYQKEMIALQAEEDRTMLSPLDTSSQHTFMGNIVRNFTPMYTSAASMPSKLMSVFSIPLSLASQKTNAITTAEAEAAYSACDDDDYAYIGVAADPFCNVIYAMPQKYLDIDPAENAKALEDAALISASGEPGNEFKTFVDECILRESPMGYAGDDGGSNDGADCKIDDENASKYLYWLDNQAESGMSDEDANEAVNASAPADSSVSGPVDAISENSGNVTAEGWAYPLDKDSYIRKDYANHVGNDMPKPVGTKVYAIRDGTVSKVEVESAASVRARCWQTTPKGAQNNLYITSVIDGVTYTHRYAHLDRFNAQQGQNVKAGDLVGFVGLNGCTTGAHLHIDLSVPRNSGLSCNMTTKSKCYIMIRSIFGSSW